MKLKYYLRGLGVGMLATALVFIFVIIPNKQNMSDDEIREAAAKLGMQDAAPKDDGTVPDPLGTPTPVPCLQQEQTGDKSSPENITEEGTESATNQDAEKEAEPGTETGDETGAETGDETVTDTGAGIVTDTGAGIVTETGDEPETEDDDETAGENDGSGDGETVRVEIYRKMTSEQLSADLYEKGLIEDAAEFNRFLITNRYADALKIGTYSVSPGLTYKELAKLFSNR